MGDQGGGYEQIGSASDVQNINPYTDQIMNRFQQMMPAAQAGMNDVAQQAMGADYNPEKALNMFMERIPELQDVVSESVRPMRMAGEDWAKAAADQARQDVAQQYSGQGGLYSGGFGQAVGQGMAEPYLQANQQSQQLQAQMAQNLYGQTMDQLAQQYAQGKQMEMQGLGTAGEMYGQQFNLAGQGMAQMGAPEYWQPQYVQEPEDPSVLGNALSGGVMGLATGGLPGALMGAAGGGLGAAFGQDAGTGYGMAGGRLGQGLGAGPQESGGYNFMGNVFGNGTTSGEGGNLPYNSAELEQAFGGGSPSPIEAPYKRQWGPMRDFPTYGEGYFPQPTPSSREWPSMSGYQPGFSFRNGPMYRY